MYRLYSLVLSEIFPIFSSYLVKFKFKGVTVIDKSVKLSNEY